MQCDIVKADPFAYFTGQVINRRCAGEAEFVATVNPPSQCDDGKVRMCKVCNDYEYRLFPREPMAHLSAISDVIGELMIHQFEDETSQFDPEGRWAGGIDCYVRTYRCLIPREIANDDEAISRYIDVHQEDEGFWI